MSEPTELEVLTRAANTLGAIREAVEESRSGMRFVVVLLGILVFFLFDIWRKVP